MEIQFDEPKKSLRPKKVNKFKGRNKKSETRDKFVGVRQRPSGRYVAEIKDTTQNIRMWLGTFETAEEAARAYDEAATLLRGSKTRTNFVTHVSYDSPLASRIRHLLNNRKKGTKQQDMNGISSTTSHADTTNDTTSDGSTSSTTNCIGTASGAINSTSASGVTSTSTNISTNSSNTNVNDKSESLLSSSTTMQKPNLFEDAYRPDMSNLTNEYESSSYKSNVSWDFGPIFDNFPFDQWLDMTNNDGLLCDMVDKGVSEFERMKVERQISASLYAINGVQEYMKNVQDCNEAQWNLSPLC